MLKKTRLFSVAVGVLTLTALIVSSFSFTGGVAHAKAISQDQGQHQHVHITPRFVTKPLHQLAASAAATSSHRRGSAAALPTWSSSFSSGSTNYPYTMVGTNPHNGSATTTVPVDIVPLIFTFFDGSKLDGTKITNNILASPMFQNGGYATGDNTQYADAIQRAEFWSSVSTTSQNYHVLLGKPSVHPAVTLNVPLQDGFDFGSLACVNIDWFSPQADKLATAGDPSHLTIFSALNLLQYQGSPFACGIGGYHTAVQANGSNYTYAYADYDQTGSAFQDVAALSHEISEWANDPLVNNTVPSWSVPNQPQYGCSTYLEDGDPLVGTTFQIGSYHVQDEAYFSWFAREKPSQGFQGKYDYSGQFTGYSTGC